MWYLTSKKTGEIFYLLFSKDKYIVSRSAGDLILLGDTSISRTHANIQLISDNTIAVIDCNAKYGTYLNENIEKKKKLEPNVPIFLKENDRVQFGLMGNEWKVSKINICALTSTLNNEDIELLTKKLKLLSGNITNIWSEECTHLVMSTITITIKLLLALVTCLPIVQPKYFTDYLKAIEMESKTLPSTENYIPEIEESYLYQEKISFKPNKLRKSIFTGKTFIFLNQKQLEKYEMIVKAGGGHCQSAAKTKLTKFLLAKPEILIIEYEASSQSQNSQSVDKISEIICKQGKRLIPDSEIGLAILYCSTNKFCNSEYDFGPNFDALTNNEKDSIDYTNIISVDTPVNVQPKKGVKIQHVEIPETEESPKTDTFSPLIDLTENDDEEVKEIIERPEITRRSTRSTRSSFVLEKPVVAETKKRRSKAYSIKEATMDENVNKKRKVSIEKTDDNVEIEKIDKIPIGQTKIVNSTNISNKIDLEKKRKKSNELQTINKKTLISFDDEGTKDSDLPPVIPQAEVWAPIPVFAKPFEPVKPFTSIFVKTKRPQRSLDDDDDDDLFQFEESQTKRHCREPVNIKEKTMETTQNVTQDLYSGQSLFMSSAALQNRNQNSIIEKSSYKIKPVDITIIGGWLSKFNKMKLEDDNKIIEPKNEETVEWIKSIRNAFEVKLVKVLSKSVSVEEKNSTKTNQNLNTTKNFKAFVKKNNFIPQTRIIQTVPMPQINQTIR